MFDWCYRGEDSILFSCFQSNVNFLKTKSSFLASSRERKGIRVDSAKVDVIKNWSKPNTLPHCVDFQD